jgi:hypothetical protein
MIRFVGVLFYLICIAFASQIPSVTTPALFWSNKGYLGERDQISDVLATDKLVKSVFSKSVNPEIIVLFVEKEFSTKELSSLSGAYEEQPNGGYLSNLKRLIETSASSKVAPYVHGIYASSLIGTSIASDILNNLAHSNKVNVIVAADSLSPNGFSNPRTSESISNLKVEKMSIQQLEQKLGSDWEILSNGKTDVVLVYLNSDYKTDDELVGSVCNALNKVSYVAGFTGETAEVVLTSTFEELSSVYYKSSSDGSSDDDWPADIVEALLVMLPYVLILSVGITCAFQIQSELKFDAEKPKRV